MSTRAIVAVASEEGFAGVYHRFDSHPWNLGNALLIELLERRGDLQGFLGALVRDCPYGWQSYLDGTRCEESEEPAFLGPEALADQCWIDWFYLFHPARRLLEVYRGGDLPTPGRHVTPYTTVQIAPDGTTEPSVFPAPPPPWFDIAEVAGWEGLTEEANTQRASIHKALTECAELRGAAMDSTREALCGLLERCIAELEWVPPEPRETAMELARLRQLNGASARVKPIESRANSQHGGALRTTFLLTESDRYWRLRLGSVSLLYPWATAYRQDDDQLNLVRADGYTANLTQLMSTLSEAAKGEAAEALHAFMLASARAQNDGVEIDVHEGQLLAFKRVVDVVENPLTEISAVSLRSDGYAVDVGEEMGIALELRGVTWSLLDVLRP